MRTRYDAAIVGAGPAGAVFAGELARLRPELHILLIDGQTADRTKPCGGLLAPDAQKVLAESGLTLPKRILADPQIFAVETIDLCSGLTRTYQRHYLNMDRYAFDRWLLSLIPERVEVVGSRCEDIAETNDGFTLRLADRTVTADCVIGADGGGSLVRRKLIGLMPKQYISIQEWYTDRGQCVPPYACIFDAETSDSCSWTIRKDGFLIYGGAFDKRGCRAAFARQKARLEDVLGTHLGEPVKREACLVTSPRRLNDFCCGKPGVYLLGEAAGFISASSFEGISSAITSGKLLAEAFASGKTPAQILRIYRKKTESLRRKLYAKTFKRQLLCSPAARTAIMASGIQSLTKEPAPHCYRINKAPRLPS